MSKSLPFAITAAIVALFVLLRWMGPRQHGEANEEKIHVQNSRLVQTSSGNILELSQEAVKNAGITVTAVQARNGAAVLSLNEIVYLDGRAWVYRAVGVAQFERIPVQILDPTGPSLVQVSGLRSGESVVNSGTGLLLSEELKSKMVEEF